MAVEADDGITPEYTDVSPAHFVFKIDSFSPFSDNDHDGFGSAFPMGFQSPKPIGRMLKRLILCPNGDKSRNGEGHVSIYLAVSETNPLKVGSDVNTIISFSVFDQIRDTYLGSTMRYCAMRSRWGIPRFVPPETFKNQSNRYLIDDTCVFSVEVFCHRELRHRERLTLKKDLMGLWDYSAVQEVRNTADQKPSRIIRSRSLRNRRRKKYKDMDMDDEAYYGITTEYTDVSPAHYVLKIESFSLFSDNGIDMYETNDFESGGHKWRLILYPNGDESRDGEGYVSIYLAVSETSPLNVGSDVNAIVRFFVFDQIRDTYLVKRGSTTRFRAMRSKWGIPRFVPLETFKDRTNGYLIDDTSIFGVEVFVIKNSGIGECLALKKGTSSHTHEWKIPNFSSLVEECCYSEMFFAGKRKWQVRLYPRGISREKNKSLSIFLCLVDSEKLAPQQKVNVRFCFRMRGQDGAVYEGPKGSHWFSSSSSLGGWTGFMLLEHVGDFLVNDECVVEAEVTVLGASGKLT
ncbi:uncharacterized protein LOC115756269 [Rhodamnia argentea]|uniref:Uncharacterized protein LOC115756269 n=1 Tax=Rhodamnia argentea TaxID=178133 RepID=A0ABM3HMR3_9MYRT|nr:uncharacterized protein LOC115756269 [Rhodamnia argentea]